MNEKDRLREVINSVEWPDFDFLRDWTLEDYKTKDLRKLLYTEVGKYHRRILAALDIPPLIPPGNTTPHE